MTRQNVTEGVREIISRHCPTCDGDGVVLSEETVAIEFDRKLRELAARTPASVEALLVQVHPDVSVEFTGQGARMLHELEEATGKVFHFEGSDSLPYDHFDIVMEGTVEEVRERAVPFQEGEEVLVTIVEPHMYNVDDAVAKIDGYVVSVSGGGRHIGEKRLVRIEEAGRNSARATLVGVAPEEGVAVSGEPSTGAVVDGSAETDGLQSKPRRRGRRGGRRRSAARAAADAAQAADTSSE
jgi:ribonuclease G